MSSENKRYLEFKSDPLTIKLTWRTSIHGVGKLYKKVDQYMYYNSNTENMYMAIITDGYRATCTCVHDKSLLMVIEQNHI